MTTASEPAASILSVPPELIHHILASCSPTDIATFSKVCRISYDLVYSGDQFLWRELFLQHYDDPRKAILTLAIDEAAFSAESFNWKNELQRRTEAEIIVRQTPHDRRRALEILISATIQALPASRNLEEQERPSYNLQWLDRVLRETHILSQIVPQNDSEMIQLYSRLRAYISLTHDPSTNEESRQAVAARRIESRCFVYDIRNYKHITYWGPFLTNGSVNWQHIEHLANVVLTNLRELPGLWAATVPPLGLENTRAFSAPGPYSDTDWAGVEGTWRRYVCFMDYRDLFTFNYSNVAHGPRNPEFFRDSRFREATRLIEIKLQLVTQSQLRFHDPAPDSENLKTRYPTLFFCGTSRGISGNEAKIEGNVSIGIDGTVRWTFVSAYGAVHHSSTLWCSKGVQLGGIASAAGIVGSWSTSMHEQGDPVGPFWLWKVPHAHSGPLMDFT
ncbi:hypothetical protein J3R30DRAFT_3487757 [Lentinula aciculospora]|uniref:F-box domain-containing protein n=1 Tax=Lentinula aciculospora TaxID=153920 RepID=A0A9W9A970_9AGAR|nr:hypothetical protein J3R30DRAFT_3487757 [Lentinula aciculospora]